MMEHLENGSEPRAENETEDVKPEELAIGGFEHPEEAQPFDGAGEDAHIAGQDQDTVKEAEGLEAGETDNTPPWTSHEDYLDSLLNGM